MPVNRLCILSGQNRQKRIIFAKFIVDITTLLWYFCSRNVSTNYFITVDNIMQKNHVVTIKDVSDRAGVAISTVSRVLNGLDRVSDETRIKVEKAVEELGYVKNSLAASMKTGKSKMIVVVVPDIINEYYTAVVQGVEEIASNEDYYTMICSSRDSHMKEQELFSGELGMVIDGVIIIPAYDDLEYYRNIAKPVVIIDRYVSGSDMHAVVIDNYKGSYLLTEELILAGHRNIAFVSGALEFNIGMERLNGYREALKNYGLEIRQENEMIDHWYQEHGYLSTKSLLEREDPPTAIFAANNLLCIGCIKAIREKRLEIGRDISLVGFDDSAVAQLLDPDITVVKRATTEMGKIGMTKLLDIINKNQHPVYPKKVVLDVELVRRHSVGTI